MGLDVVGERRLQLQGPHGSVPQDLVDSGQLAGAGQEREQHDRALDRLLTACEAAELLDERTDDMCCA